MVKRCLYSSYSSPSKMKKMLKYKVNNFNKIKLISILQNSDAIPESKYSIY